MQNELTVEGIDTDLNKLKVKLYSIHGTEIRTQSEIKNGKLVITNLNSLQKGVYILQIDSGVKKYSFKVLK